MANEGITRAREHYSDGLVHLTTDGLVISMDANADRVLKSDMGLRYSGGRLRLSGEGRAGEVSALDTFISNDGEDIEPFVFCSSSERRLIFHLYNPLNSNGKTAQHTKKVLRIAVIDFRRTYGVSTVKHSFSLTSAEQSVVSALCASSSATAAADRLGLSRETVKTHLRSIYAKTGCVSLAELMLLIGKFANR